MHTLESKVAWVTGSGRGIGRTIAEELGGRGARLVIHDIDRESAEQTAQSLAESGYTTMADAEALGRMISLALRSGVDPKEVISQLKGIGGSEPIFTEGGLVQSLPDAIAKVLERHLGESKNNSKDDIYN